MPNHCSNQMTTNNPQIIAILKDCAERGEEDFINALVPMPLELRGIMTGGTKLDDGTYIRKWREGPDGKVIPIPEEETERLVKTYGTDDWYEWAVRNHGTKWGAYNTVYDFTDDEAIVLFDSAWAPPRVFLDKVTRFYPVGRVQLAYAEGGMGYFGRDVFVDGDQVVEEYNENDFWNPEKSWDDCDDPDEMLTVACRAHLHEYGLHTGG